MKSKIILIFIVVIFLTQSSFAQKKALVITQINDYSCKYSQLPATGWSNNIDVKIFDQKFNNRIKSPSKEEYRSSSGIIYFINYPLGSQAFTPAMAQTTLQTLHEIKNFVSNGGNATIFINNELATKHETFTEYLSKNFDLIHVTQWGWSGVKGSTVTKFPLDGSVILNSLNGLTIGGCKHYNEIQGWFLPKPGYWEGVKIGNFTPKRYISLLRKFNDGSILFVTDCRYGSMFSDENIGLFDNYKAFEILLKWVTQ